MNFRAAWLSFSIVLTALALSATVHRFDTMYVGGTVPGLEEDTAGLTHTSDANVFTFEHKNGTLVIPYNQIVNIEYGNTLGQRGASTMAAAALLGGAPGLLAARLSNRHRHFLTLDYLDEKQQAQVAVFEIGKDRIYPTLYNLRKKSGKKLEFLDEESRKEILKLTP